MCGPIAMAVIATASAGYSMYEQNQQTQHALGAQQAQADEAKKAEAKATKIGPAQTSPVISDQSAAAQVAARKRQLAMAGGMMSTIGQGGVNPATSLVSQPQAFAANAKQFLGQ